MQLFQECAYCKRQVKVNPNGRLLKHYPKKASWRDDFCPGTGKTTSETLKENHE